MNERNFQDDSGTPDLWVAHAKGDGAHGLWAILEIPGSEELVHQRKETEDANDRHGKELLKLVIPSTSNIYTCLKAKPTLNKREWVTFPTQAASLSPVARYKQLKDLSVSILLSFWAGLALWVKYS